jgi:hypothetical protein
MTEVKLKNIVLENNRNFKDLVADIELPFHEISDSTFFRMSGYISNFYYDAGYKDFVVDIYLGLKIKTRFLMGHFIQKAGTRFKREFYLFKKGFVKKNKVVNFRDIC